MAELADSKPDRQKDKAAGVGDENEEEDAEMLREFEGVPRSSTQTYKEYSLL